MKEIMNSFLQYKNASFSILVLAGIFVVQSLLSACGDDSNTDDTSLVDGLYINEVMSKNDGTLLDEQDEADDWIELYNASGEAIVLEGFTIRDNKSEKITLGKIRLPANGHLILWADDAPDQGATHLPFKLSSSGDNVILEDASGNEIDRVDIPELGADQSFSRFPDGRGEFKTCVAPTPASENGSSCDITVSSLLSETVTFAEYTPVEKKKSSLLAG